MVLSVLLDVVMVAAFHLSDAAKMRFWCVPSASESPQLPPRVRSPPPTPPRLTTEEKLARGVINKKKKTKNRLMKVKLSDQTHQPYLTNENS